MKSQTTIYLEVIGQTEKAFKTNFGWVPKSVVGGFNGKAICTVANWFIRKSEDLKKELDRQNQASKEFWANPENQAGYKAWRKSGLTLSDFKAINY